MVGEQVVGAMSTQSYRANAFSEQELDMFWKLGQPVACALEKTQLRQTVQAQAQELSQIQLYSKPEGSLTKRTSSIE